MNTLDKEKYKAKYQKLLVFIIMPLLCIGAVLAGLQNTSPREDYEHGIAAYTKGDYTNAVQDFRQDIVQNPNHSLGHYYLALSLCREGNTQGARNEFNAAARTEMLSEHPDAAFAQKCAALENNPDCAHAL